MNRVSKKTSPCKKIPTDKNIFIPVDVDVSTDDTLSHELIFYEPYELKIDVSAIHDSFTRLYKDLSVDTKDNAHITQDWLTGFYMASKIIPCITFNKFTIHYKTFHAGILTGNFIGGFSHFIKNMPPHYVKNIKWDWTGTDLCKKNGKFLKINTHLNPINLTKGIMGNGDATNENNLRYWFNQYEVDKFDMIMFDIKNKKSMISGINFALNTLKSNGIFVMRVLKLDNIGLQCIRLASLIWKTAGLWRVPWGGRIYLICSHVKKSINKHKKIDIFKLIRSDKAFFPKQMMVDWSKYINFPSESMLLKEFMKLLI